jgi:hypothetical protein
MRQSSKVGEALVVAVTSSDSGRGRQVMTNLGAAAYFCKPSDYQKFMKLGELAKGLLEKARE